jgi:predicted small integral membrane protein
LLSQRCGKDGGYDIDHKTSEVALIIRLAKAILCVPLALFGLLVAADNVVDYGTNYAFVQHVFSMDPTFPGNALMGRAITNPAVWRLGYGAIIVGEVLTGLCW